MADRYFPNEMPEFIPETLLIISTTPPAGNSLTKLLHLPYDKLCKTLTSSALKLKETVVKETWGKSGKRVQDYTVYTGVLGTAYLLFKSYQLTNNKADLALSLDIVKACDTASRGSKNITFTCGRSGVCALGAVLAKEVGDQQLQDHYLTQFRQINLPVDLPHELLYGRAGYLWSCSFLNKHIAEGTIPNSTMRGIVKEIIKGGRKLRKLGCPLMYEWHGKKYWGAAHGLAGILHVLMDMELEQDEVMDVKATLRYMIRGRYPSGNYPSSEGSQSDLLVHWCHGAPGLALTLAKAAQVYGDRDFLQAAKDAAELVWNRGLLKRVGICHGISGNTYVFLTLYRLTGNEEYLYRAKAFACFLHDRARRLIGDGVMHGGDRPFSLFEGLGGMAYLFLDMNDPASARFPAYEL